MGKGNYEAVVIGVSAGGLQALSELLPALPAKYPLPIIVVQHIHSTSDGYLIHYLGEKCSLAVKEADEKETIQQGTIYFAPPNYHLLVEGDFTMALNVDEKIRYSRPSVDVLFESAAEAYQSKLVGIVLTGANDDGSHGLKMIKEHGGLAIVQDPSDAEYSVMPEAAIASCQVDFVLPLAEIGRLLIQLGEENG